VNPWLLARAGNRFRTQVPLRRMNRLASMVVAQEGQASVDLGGRVDPQGRAWLEGSVEASVRLLCQRCLDPLDWDLSTRFAFRLLDTPVDADSIPRELESMVVEPGECVDLDGLVEDELILAMPIVARHEDTDCGSQPGANRGHEDTGQTTHRPFADLAEILARENGQTKE